MRRYFGAELWDLSRGGEFWDTLPTFLHNLPLYDIILQDANKSPRTVGNPIEPGRVDGPNRGNPRNPLDPPWVEAQPSRGVAKRARVSHRRPGSILVTYYVLGCDKVCPSLPYRIGVGWGYLE